MGATHNVADSHRRVQADDGKLAAGSGAYIVREEPTDPILRTRRSAHRCGLPPIRQRRVVKRLRRR